MKTALSEVCVFSEMILRVSFYDFYKKDFKQINWGGSLKFGAFIDKYFSGEYIPSANYVDEKTDVSYLSVRAFTGHEPDFNNVKFLPDDLLEKYEKIKLRTGDIVFTRSASVGHVHLIGLPDGKIYIPSHHLLVVRVNNDFIKTPFMMGWLKTNFVKNFLFNFSQGKNQKELTNWSVKNLPIPNWACISDFESLNRKIDDLLFEEAKLKSKIQDPLEIINKVFAEEFKFSYEDFERFKKTRFKIFSFSDFSNNKDLRCSFRFHNPAYRVLHEHLTSIFKTKLKDYISEPVVLGKGISPDDYDEGGRYYYISMADIKEWYFNKMGSKTVKDEFYISNTNKTVFFNDIIMARSGEGTIGKVALMDDDEVEGIFADFTMRIRLKDYSPLFAYYYFRSDFFQFYVYTHKKGLGNNTNVFPNQVHEFPMPDFPEKKQISIIDKIKSKLDEQKEIEKQIEDKRREISKIIEEAIVA